MSKVRAIGQLIQHLGLFRCFCDLLQFRVECCRASAETDETMRKRRLHRVWSQCRLMMKRTRRKCPQNLWFPVLRLSIVLRLGSKIAIKCNVFVLLLQVEVRRSRKSGKQYAWHRTTGVSKWLPDVGCQWQAAVSGGQSFLCTETEGAHESIWVACLHSPCDMLQVLSMHVYQLRLPICSMTSKQHPVARATRQASCDATVALL